MTRAYLVFLLGGLTACSLYWPSKSQPIADAFLGDDDGPTACSQPAPGSNCTCTDTIGWACNSCPFDEGPGPVACDSPGSGCELETWEHGCSCACGSDGWWSCMPETIGSTCPTEPPPDAGVQPACARIQAESITDHGDWSLVYGSTLDGGEGLTASSGSGVLEFQFTGTGLDVQIEQGPTTGIVSIAIDDAAPIVATTTVPDSDFAFRTMAIASALAPGTHTARVTCPVLVCSIDYFAVTCD
jgi:hypothetical protein